MAVKKTAAEQNAENAVSAEPAQSKPGVSIYVGPSILGYIQKNTIYPCAAAEAVERDDVKIATEKYPGVADFIINVDELHTTPEKAKARGEAILAFARMDCHQGRQELYQVEPHARPGRNAVCVLPGVLCWAERQAP